MLPSTSAGGRYPARCLEIAAPVRWSVPWIDNDSAGARAHPRARPAASSTAGTLRSVSRTSSKESAPSVYWRRANCAARRTAPPTCASATAGGTCLARTTPIRLALTAGHCPLAGQPRLMRGPEPWPQSGNMGCDRGRGGNEGACTDMQGDEPASKEAAAKLARSADGKLTSSLRRRQDTDCGIPGCADPTSYRRGTPVSAVAPGCPTGKSVCIRHHSSMMA